MNKYLIISFMALSVSLTAQDSKRTNIWYFGRNAGIDFNAIPPSPLTDGALNIWEGCATFCDTSGQLMIYTDGIKIWNKNHQVMPGATNLGGDNSATQSGIIVPKPNSNNEIFVISVDKEGNSGGLRYATVDMNLNGGLGGLINSNNVLLSQSTEKVTAIQHCNKIDYWLIAHKTNSTSFYVWEVTSAGISSPSIQSIGSNHGNSNTDAIGYLKGSPNGSKLALGVYGDEFFEVFSFDNATGTISNPITLINSQISNPYGVEFSPNSELVYVAGTQSAPRIFQYNLALPTNQQIQNSGILIGTGTSSYFGALQLGPDNKIYVAKENSNFLSIINNPNNVGLSCNFIENEFNLGGKESALGLPNLIPSFFLQPTSLVITSDIDTCNGTANLTALTNVQGDSIIIEWYLDNQIIENQASTSIQVYAAGEYTIKVKVFDCLTFPIEYSQSISVYFSQLSTLQTITICEGGEYEGYSTSGTYTDVYLASNGCDSTRVLTLIVLPNLNTSLNVSICDGENYSGYTTNGTYTDIFTSSGGCDSTRILTLTVLPNATSTKTASICQGEIYEGYSSSGTYVDVFNAANGCDSTRTLTLSVNKSSEFSQSITICAGSNYNFNGRIITTEGIYLDTISNLFGCDSIITLDLKIAQSNFLGNDTTICTASEYKLISPSDNTRWFDNETIKTKKINETGIYWAAILDANGCEILDTVFVQFALKTYIPNVFSPNDDGVNDCFQPFFSELGFSSYRFSVFDRWGSHIFSTSNPDDCWDGEYRGKKCTPDVYVYFVEIKSNFCERTVMKGDITLMK